MTNDVQFCIMFSIARRVLAELELAIGLRALIVLTCLLGRRCRGPSAMRSSEYPTGNDAVLGLNERGLTRTGSFVPKGRLDHYVANVARLFVELRSNLRKARLTIGKKSPGGVRAIALLNLPLTSSRAPALA
jgi:hypothetical protein